MICNDTIIYGLCHMYDLLLMSHLDDPCLRTEEQLNLRIPMLISLSFQNKGHGSVIATQIEEMAKEDTRLLILLVFKMVSALRT